MFPDVLWFSVLQVISEAGYSRSLHSSTDLEHSRSCEGQFEEDYLPLRSVGNGAFGFVWLASRRHDGLEVRQLKLMVSEHMSM